MKNGNRTTPTTNCQLSTPLSSMWFLRKILLWRTLLNVQITFSKQTSHSIGYAVNFQRNIHI